MVVDVPGVDKTVVSAGPIEEAFAVVFEHRATAESAQAKVIEADVPLGPLGRMADAQNRVRVQVDKRLIAEHAVVAIDHAVEVQRRALQVGGEERPVEHRHAFHDHDVVFAGHQLLVFGDRLAGVRIDFRHAGEWIDHRHLVVFEREIARFEFVGGNADAAGGDAAALGDIAVGADLAQHVGAQAHQALVARHGREHFAVENHAHAQRHVVVHRLGLHDAISLAHHHVAFQIELQRRAVLLLDLTAGIGWLQPAGPNDHAIGRYVERAGKRRGARALQAVDHGIHAGAEHGDGFVGRRAGIALDLQRHIAAREEADAARAGQNHFLAGNRGFELRALQGIDFERPPRDRMVVNGGFFLGLAFGIGDPHFRLRIGGKTPEPIGIGEPGLGGNCLGGRGRCCEGSAGRTGICGT